MTDSLEKWIRLASTLQHSTTQLKHMSTLLKHFIGIGYICQIPGTLDICMSI